MTNVSFYCKNARYFCFMVSCENISARQLKDFNSLSLEDKLKLLRSSEHITLPKESVVFEENQSLTKLFCIKKGACKYIKTDNSGTEHVLRYLGEGEVMGKRSLVANEGSNVSAITLCSTELCCLDKNEIVRLMCETPQFCNDFYDALVEDLNINEQYRLLFGPNKSIKARLANLLIHLISKFGVTEDGKMRIRVKRDDMAATLGTSQEYIINLLKSFKNFGMIDIIKGEIYVISKQRLLRLSEKY